MESTTVDSTVDVVPKQPWPGARLLWALTSPAVFALFATLLVLYSVLGTYFLDVWGSTDFWEHLAAIDAFARSPLAPNNPYVPHQSIHLFTPYHLLWGLVAAATHSSAYTLAPVAAGVNSVLFILALPLLARRLTGSSRFALPLGLAMLFLWYQPWQWSGFPNFGLLPLTMVYPYWFALPLAMIAMGAIDESRQAGAWALTLRALAVAFVFLVHPLSGSFLALTLAIRAIAERSIGASARLVRAGVSVAGLALSLAWPYMPMIAVIAGAPQYGSRGFGGDWRLFYEQAPIRLLPACVGLLYYAPAFRRRSLDWMSWTFLACTAIYLLNPLLTRNAFLSRYVIYVAMLLQWGAVRALAMPQGTATPRLSKWALAIFLVVLVPAAAFEVRASIGWLGAPWSQLQRGPAPDYGNRGYVRRLRDYRPYLSTRDVTMAPMKESWMLPAVVGTRVVGLAHSNPFLYDFEARRAAVATFYDPATGRRQREALIARYGVTRVLVRAGDAARLEGVGEMPLLFGDGVYEVRAVSRQPSGQPRAPDAHASAP